MIRLSAYLAGDYGAHYDLELRQLACDEEPM